MEGGVKRLIIGALALAFVTALVFATLRESRVRCELCVSFGGNQVCRKAAAADRGQAISMAQNGACAVLAGGVTRGMQCMRVVPQRVRCEGDPSP